MHTAQRARTPTQRIYYIAYIDVLLHFPCDGFCLAPICTHQGNYTLFNFRVRYFDLGFGYFWHFLVLLLLIARTLAFLNQTLAYV
jgi:hypothetical protein